MCIYIYIYVYLYIYMYICICTLAVFLVLGVRHAIQKELNLSLYNNIRAKRCLVQYVLTSLDVFFTVSEDDSPVVMCDQPKFDWRSRRLLSYLALVFFQVDRHKEVVQCE